MPRKTGKIPAQVALAYLAIFLIYFLDQLSKACVRRAIPLGDGIPVIKGVFHLTLVNNTGVAFGLFSSHSYLFIVVAVLALIIINYFLLCRINKLNVAERIALCFICAGTMGNLTDRLRFGHVIDFIDLRIWPVFNVADSFITMGAVILGWTIFFGAKRADRVKGQGSRTKTRKRKNKSEKWKTKA